MPYKNRQDRRAAEKRYKDRNRDAVRAANAARDKANPSALAARKARWSERNPMGARKHKLSSRYGLTEADFEALLNKQGRACAICRCDLDNVRQADRQIDHDHVTKVVRGVLCRPCNLGLGHFKDNPEVVRAAADYLERAR
jgi:hypothetical protein